MSVHISAQEGDIADIVFLPGDPLRAKFMATEYLQDARCYSEVRGMLGFTGTVQGRRISVQGSGMGMPSMAIYVNELIQFYGAKTIIRLGSCGSLQKDMKLHDIVLPMASSSDSAMNLSRFPYMQYSPCPDFQLLHTAYAISQKQNLPCHVGSIFSTDTFYHDKTDAWKTWAEYGILAVEMETHQLYTLAAKHGIRSLSILSVSDSLVNEEELESSARERGFTKMMELACELALQC